MNTSVAVRELCDFTAKRGDLDLRFTPVPTAREGMAGHNAVAATRGKGYQREITLRSVYKSLAVRGRADGMRPEPLVLEEIKTHRGDLDRMPANHRALHWAQLKIYGAQLCEQNALPELDLNLVYFDVDALRETPLRAVFSAEELRGFYEEQCEVYLAWDLRQREHRQTRDAALAAMPFPHADFHSGQRILAEAVYRAAARGSAVMIQAPTGIGKSIGVLFPALKAMAQQHLDKIFYLTAKTSGRSMALDALASLRAKGEVLPLRVLELVARDKACVHTDKACHGESCPLAKGFYDRLPAAREAAVARNLLDQAAVREVAQQHGVCPYYLSQDLVRWSDVVVGDYNYYFDRSALLHAMTTLNEWRVAVLVDEAHNLVERARAMYSAELRHDQMMALRRSGPRAVRSALHDLHLAWTRFAQEQDEDYRVYPQIPPALTECLKGAVAAIGEFFNANPAGMDMELQRFWFDALGFLGLAEQLGEQSLFDVSVDASQVEYRTSTLCIRNLVPAPHLAPRIADAATTVAFSATLAPPHYFRDLLGFSATTPWVDVPSPFSPAQLEVHVVRTISTRYHDRPGSIRPLADIIAAQFARRPGNYLVFASSYRYLQQIALELRTVHPQLPLLEQSSGMSEGERAGFIAQFTVTGAVIGLAVLGGAFAEGIDLPGRRLLGAFVATLGLPQVNAVNEQVLARMQALFGETCGYDYTYLFPGLAKVVQAGGRVIRGTQDRGVLYLVDDRFGQQRVEALLPMLWRKAHVEFSGPPAI